MGCQQGWGLLDTDRSSEGSVILEEDFTFGTHLADVAVRPRDLHAASNAVEAINIVKSSIAVGTEASAFVEIGKLCGLYGHLSPFQFFEDDT